MLAEARQYLPHHTERSVDISFRVAYYRSLIRSRIASTSQWGYGNSLALACTVELPANYDQTELDKNTSNLLFHRLVFGNQPGEFVE
jgi:hypothetical protein